MNSKKSLTIVLAALLFALILPAAALAAGVLVECAFTDTDVVCDIFADATGTTGLRSGGVQLTTTNCTATGATKNTNDWWFGPSAPGIDYPNSPDLSDPKAPNVIVGILDTSVANTVVTGARVKMGTVTFLRDNTDAPDITADLARPTYPNFVSFVDAGTGQSLDATIGANMTTIINLRGDANGSGAITPSDINAVKGYIGNPDAPIWADCNGSGLVTPSDINCVKGKIF